VRDLALIFAEDWAFETEERLHLPQAAAVEPKELGCVVGILPSGPDQETNATGLTYFAGIAQARSRCLVASPYFIPDEATLRALVATAMRGVDVRVLVPQASDVAFMRTAIRSFYPTLIDAGIRVYEYQPAMLHAKTLIVDGEWCLIGSANLDVRSFRLNFEVSALVADRAFAAAVEKQFHADLASAVEITADAIEQRTFGRRLAEGSARLLSPLL
jgi:cardiolipin synthase